jgi:hypothetical protein
MTILVIHDASMNRRGTMQTEPQRRADEKKH